MSARVLGFCMISLGLILVSCTKKSPDTPQGVLEAYIKTAINAKNIKDRETLIDLTTGLAREDLVNMSDQEFESQFIKNSIKFTSFVTKDVREEASGDVSMVYELSYDEKKEGVGSASVANKKIAYLGRDEKGNWKIKETKNVKSFVEQKEAMEVMATPGGAASEKSSR